MAHFQVTVTPEPSDAIEWDFVGDEVVTVRFGPRSSMFFLDPEQLERLAEVAMEAARDLRFAQLSAIESRSLSSGEAA